MAASNNYDQYISAASKKYGVPEKLIRQVISVESSGNPNAASGTGPVGLMQISKALSKQYGYDAADRYDPQKNIEMGTRYLKDNLEHFKGNATFALLGYNQGTGGAEQQLSGKKAMSKEGWNYIHNKKFSPEYLAKNGVVPKVSDYMTPATSALLKAGESAVQPQKPEYNTAALGDVHNASQELLDKEEAEKKKKGKGEEGMSSNDRVALFQQALAGLKTPEQQSIGFAPAFKPRGGGQLDMNLFSNIAQETKQQNTGAFSPTFQSTLKGI